MNRKYPVNSPISSADNRDSVKVSLLTGGKDPHYALGLLRGLLKQGCLVEFVGNDEMEKAATGFSKKVSYFNLRGDQTRDAVLGRKVARVLTYYFHLIRYAWNTDSTVLHILWHNKFIFFDSTVLLFYYKALGKRIVYTVHNVNQAERDGRDNVLNRLTLKVMYGLFDHLFVHTDHMREQLRTRFEIPASKITVIPFGLNDAIPRSDMSFEEARQKIELNPSHKVVLFFGNIAPYKGLEFLVQAHAICVQSDPSYRLIIAGNLKASTEYWNLIDNLIKKKRLQENIVQRIYYIPDEEAEIYFKSADVLVLPYRKIFQTGVLFLAYSFGVPVIASDVATIHDSIVEGETGFLCRPEDPLHLAEQTQRFFDSDIYRDMDATRNRITRFAEERFSWQNISHTIFSVYIQQIGPAK